MIAELRLERIGVLADIDAESGVFERLDHLATTEEAKVAAISAAGAEAMFIGKALEVLKGLNFAEDFFGLLDGLDEDVTGPDLFTALIHDSTFQKEPITSLRWDSNP